MNRTQINQLKRARRKANDFVNKRMKLDIADEAPSSSTPLVSFQSDVSMTDPGEVTSDLEISTNRNISTSNVTNGQAESYDFNKEIASWVVNSKTPAMHVDSLLRILQTKVPDLPITCKTLLNTPKNAYEDVMPMCKGSYLHIGLERMLGMFLSTNELQWKKIILDVGIDGTPSTDSSDTELWPILVNVVGFEDILLVGCYFGSGKPKDDDGSSDEFLTPFVKELLEIFENGGITFGNETYDLEFRAFVMDAPARAFIMNTLSHTGYQSCTKCTVDGIRIAKRIVFHGVEHELRSNFTFRNRTHTNHHHSDATTMIEQLPIDCVKMVPVDPMHCIYLGVTKQLLKLWIVVRKKPYSISAKNIKLLSGRIECLARQLPSEFCRKPRHLKHLKRFKATEFHQFVLYTLPIVLEGVLPKNFYDNFLKLHCAVRILSTPEDCIRNNALAEELLKDFVKEFGICYGYLNLSFNIHSLLHLAQDVLNFNSPLESYSAFKFENFLQYLKKLSRNNYRVLEQIRNRFFEKFSVNKYEGDFKRRIKRNRKDKRGNLTDIHVHHMHLSVKVPNNHVITSAGYIFKIIKIEAVDSGFNVIGSRVQNISPFYENPIASNSLGIFVSSTGHINENESDVSTIFVTEHLRKVAQVEIDNKFFFLALLH